ncbi:ATPase domain-containing protein [Pelomonas sp. Root1444]|uniref:ATPase domain-containing protein n=1 Tax=Pelomonas sp. Root1444 TaxID=1736464 RepID=UPI000702B2E0|nr:ATPase domain-containing protein [Pelomonas sp. Root1444]KQY81539.1 protein kinase [Pelomonas sp. Root1444]
MTSKVKINSLSTGVPGLDDLLGGGLPEFSFNLIAGQPGCGKTTLAHQLMFSLATEARPALYFTVLGEPPLKMLRYQQQFAFFDAAAVNRSVHFVNLCEEAMAGDLDHVLARITEEVARHEPALVFVDSFRSVVLATDGGGNAHNHLQRFMQQLGMLMTSWQATTFLIGEYFTDTDANPVFTVADGLIWMRQSVQRNSMVRKMEIMKMRGQPSLPGLHPFRISRDGLHIFVPTPAAAPPAKDGGKVPRASMGVRGLDEMMDGGLPRGYSLLVAGPSGSGKSILAAAFLDAGVRNGETGVIAAFERRPNRVHSSTLAQAIADDRVGVVESHAADVSIEEVMQLLVAEIRRLSASRVVIDSLSGFELALGPSFKEDFRESLLRLVMSLTGLGVTVLMTSELEDRYTDLRFSPYGTAFMTDAIIVQRYIEVQSRLRRVLAVVKVRDSRHSDELREYRIGDDGIELGTMLAEQEGLLGGRPATRAPASPARGG